MGLPSSLSSALLWSFGEGTRASATATVVFSFPASRAFTPSGASASSFSRAYTHPRDLPAFCATWSAV